MTCTSEAGMVIAGSMDSTIEGLVLEDVAIELVQQTDFAGGFLDYRPGMRGIVDDVQTSAIFVEFANHVNLSSVEARPLLTCHIPAAITQVTGVSLEVTVSLLGSRQAVCRQHELVPGFQSPKYAICIHKVLSFCGSCRWCGGCRPGRNGARRWRSRLAQSTPRA